MSFGAAFKLLDWNGAGRIGLDEVHAFVENLDNPPSKFKVVEVYKKFDVDGSGDIDAEEFLDLCTALEQLTSTSAEVMSAQFKNKLLQKLFDLVDDGVGKNAGDKMISKEEFKFFFEVGAEILQGRRGGADVGTLIRDFPGDGLDFAQFSEVICKVIVGLNIGKVVHDFEAVKQARKEARAKARERFQSAGGKVSKINNTIGALDTTMAEKEHKERQQQQQRPRANTASSTRSATPPKSPGATQTPPPSSRAPSDNCFAEAFALLDTRGGGSITLDSVYEFCEALPAPPQQNSIRKLYNQFDDDGSGDIDEEEFVGFCQALEKLTGIAAPQMVDLYSRAMYQRLFELVDDGGDGNQSVSKDELKVLLESISGMLSARYTAADVTGLVRDFDGELSFDDFVDVVKKLTVGKSISQVVAAFEEARRRRKAAKHAAFSKFEGTEKEKRERPAQELNTGLERLCFACVEKDEKIKEQQKLIDQLQGELAVVRAQASSTGAELESAKAASEWAAKTTEDTLTGNPFAAVRALATLSSASSFKRYPELIKPGLQQVQTQRVLDHCRFFEKQCASNGKLETDIVVRECNEAAPKAAETQKELQALIDTEVLQEFQAFAMYQGQLVDGLESGDEEEIKSQLEMLEAMREKLKSHRDDGNWIVDRLLTIRQSCCDSAICIAPFTSKSSQIMENVMEAEERTQKLLDMFTVMMMHGSEQVSDTEVMARKFLAKQRSTFNPEEILELRNVNAQVAEQLSREAWEEIFQQLSRSLNVLTRSMSLSTAVKREKGVQTQPQVDMMPLIGRKKKEERPESQTDRGAGYTTPRSAAPRVRAIRRELPKDTTQHVDKILDRYVAQEGVEVPPNFKRVDPNGNTFQFGSRKIELMPVDRFVCVKVGGGYLLFDEFCEKYCQAENRKFKLLPEGSTCGTPRTTITRSSTPTYGRTPIGTPRPGTPGANTPRTLVRTTGGLKLS